MQKNLEVLIGLSITLAKQEPVLCQLLKLQIDEFWSQNVYKVTTVMIEMQEEIV